MATAAVVKEYLVTHADSLRGRFFHRIEKSDGCWIWNGGRDSDGYGLFSPRHTMTARATAVMLIFEGRKEPFPGAIVRHTCDNPPCVNPAHLVYGSHRDNAIDRMIRGRGAAGDRNGARKHREMMRRGFGSHPRAVLTDSQVLEIRRRVGAGELKTKIACSMAIHPSTVSHVANGVCYSHVRDADG